MIVPLKQTNPKSSEHASYIKNLEKRGEIIQNNVSWTSQNLSKPWHNNKAT